MNQEEFTKAMMYLGYAYNKGFTKEEVAVWYDFFKEYSLDDMECAIKRVIPKNKFLPSIAELNDEWFKAISTIRKYGRYRIDLAMQELEPHSKDIIEQIGIERICNSTNIEWERKMFLDLFKNKQAQETNCQLVGSYLTKLETSRSDIGLIE